MHSCGSHECGISWAELQEASMTPVALVVDDSMLIRHTVCRFLEERGFAVESATNGADALEMLQALRPSLIVTDLQMPKMNGSELIAALRKDPATEHIPIVVVAGRSNGGTKELHADFVIYKDIGIEEQLKAALAKTFAAQK